MQGLKKKSIVLHPLLFALFPTVFLFAHNIDQVLVVEILWPLATSLVFGSVLFLFWRLVFKDIHKAGFAASVFLFFFFSYGPVFDAIEQGFRLRSPYRLHAGLMPIAMCGLICSEYLVGRIKRNLSNLTRILNFVSMICLAISIVQISAYGLRNAATEDHIADMENLNSQITGMDQRRPLPDIYYIIVDRYASANTLMEFYDYDNSPFVEYLSDRGFYVASKSNANYLCTAQSLASSLNMKHITYMSEQVGEDTHDWKPVYRMLQDYTVWRFLKSKGYEFVHFGPRWFPTSRNKYADKNVNVRALSEFSMLLYETTLLHPISRFFGFLDFRVENHRRVLYQFDKLSEIPDMEGPVFVFVHFLLPHEPYVFDDSGDFVTRKQASERSTTRKYLDQIVFTNRKLQELIDTLLSSSQPPPIIIVQADEGPYPQGLEVGSKPFNWQTASNAQLREKMGILNAYYLPDVNKDILYESITPVNSFRIVFNLYFGTDLGLLPDESYVFTDTGHIYKFINVTDKLKPDSQ